MPLHSPVMLSVIGGVVIGCIVIMNYENYKNFENYNIPGCACNRYDWHYTEWRTGELTGWTWNKELFPDYRKLL